MAIRDRMIDYGLAALTTESDRVFLTETDPATYADAAAFHVGQKDGVRGSMFFAITSPLQGGRQASMASFSDGDITSNGTANYVVVADSVLENILLTESLFAPQAVLSGAKFAVNALEIIYGASTQPVAASLTVSSPEFSSPVLLSGEIAPMGITVSSPVLGSPTLIAAITGWTNISVANQTGTFTCEFDATPASLALDNVLGLSNGAAVNYSDVAAAVTFTTGSVIQVRNGGSYAADSVVAYAAGSKYHIRMVVNLAAHTYDVWVTPPSLSPVQIADDYAFRTEQSAVTQLNNFARNATETGIVAISNLTFTSLVANALTVSSPVINSAVINGKANLLANNLTTSSPVLTGLASIKQRHGLTAAALTVSLPVFVPPSLQLNTGTTPGAFNSQSGNFTISWDAVPSQNLADVFCGLSLGTPTVVSDFACIARFNPSGNIDVRNGASYGATTTIPYSAGTTFRFRFVVRMSSHTYDVYVTPQGQSEVLIANNFAFRADQAAVASLNFLGKFQTTGTVTLSNMLGPPPEALPPIVAIAGFNLATSGATWVAGAVVGTMTATRNPTSWQITAGNGSGFFAISNSGIITVTAAGITGLNNATGNVVLTCQATNGFGNGSNTATVTYAPALAIDIPLSFNDPMFTGMSVGSGAQMTTNQLIQRRTVTGQDSGLFIFNQVGQARVSYCRMTMTVGNDCPILTQVSDNIVNVDHCFIDNNAPTNPTR
jgi:hypothetical protein